jgi:hypothetical protein
MFIGPPTDVSTISVENCSALEHCFSKCGRRTTGGPRRSANGFGRKMMTKIVSDTELIKNTPVHVCAKTSFVGWPSTESRQISSFHNFLFFSHYFRELFKWVQKKCSYGNFDYRYNVAPIHLHALRGVWTFTKVVRVCTDCLWSGPWLPKVWETLA